MGARLLRWAIFTVIFSLLPFGIVLLNLWGDAKPVTTEGLWQHGELALIATAIAADAVGDLVASGTTWAMSKIFCAGACVILLFLAAVWYAMLQSHQYTPDRVWSGNVYFFILAVLSSFGCKVLAEK